ncbi:palmitoyltransferase akr1 [Emydomyces testavorans]|uniref:protein S-acyltransferase n=1 Tax=Emydomyces testavorans TaxID=2070801 RepID=A0AAF0DIB4_9EURO|nr:palmitoyltransferase akr1 [Emydomyces testavorans]
MSALPSSRESHNVTERSSTSSSTLSRKTSDASPERGIPDDEVELKEIGSCHGANGILPIEEDIMQLARLGETGAIQKLFESGKYDAKYRDEEGITPLHWAAINNRYELCKYLLESGADVDAKGGESVATPAMWAAQRCHYYIVHLLLQYGADPLLTDVQGYNILHLATIDGNAFLLVLLLHQEIPVDVTDPQGHTGLMWAAYKGFPACVDLFLRWGANVNAADEGGLTPLHWALVKGSTPCIYKILEYGADRFAKTRDGKTPATVAQEMKTTPFWRRALSECGYSPKGDVMQLPLGLATILRTRRYVSKFFLLWPFAMIFVAVWILSEFSLFISVPLTLALTFGMQWAAQWVANQSFSDFRVLHRTETVEEQTLSALQALRFKTRSISRNQTTYENMKGHSFDYADSTTRAITSAVATGTTSAELGGLSSTGQGPNPSIPPSHHRSQRHAHGGCLSQWKKLLGLDTFMATAQESLGDRRASRYRNPFSRGVVMNCRDFWCDSTPYFGRRETGTAMIGGEVVNYNDMYEVPLRLRTGESGMVYRGVATEDVEALA